MGGSLTGKFEKMSGKANAFGPQRFREDYEHLAHAWPRMLYAILQIGLFACHRCEVGLLTGRFFLGRTLYDCNPR